MKHMNTSQVVHKGIETVVAGGMCFVISASAVAHPYEQHGLESEQTYVGIPQWVLYRPPWEGPRPHESHLPEGHANGSYLVQRTAIISSGTFGWSNVLTS